MLYTIKNDFLQVQINSRGGEMMSIQTLSDNCEYLWQGDSGYWGDRAIHLFPICGRLYEGKYTYKGETYRMGAHGFLRSSEMNVVSHEQDAITFELTDSKETQLQYPFAFRLHVTYRLQKNCVTIEFNVLNTDDKTLIFTLGGHPGFGLPFEQGLRFEDYAVSFEEPCQPEQIKFSPTCFVTGETPLYSLVNNKTLPLQHDLFDNDAIFLQKMSHTVTLGSPKGSKRVTLTCNDMKYLGFWHTTKSDAPFVCIEPWLGIPSDDLTVDEWESKKDMIHLPVGETFTTEYSIAVE
ncbi:MAG: aldose 1-epimerase family protein [Clostridia bacterium]|nr:aldose 1-epimerase family protein [Clostridia bacterium]